GRIFRDGCLVALLNPKTALFFAAFLPQFIDPAGPALRQSLALGAVFVAIAATTDALYAMAAGVASPTLRRFGRMRRWSRLLAAGVYFGLAALTLAASTRMAQKR
ncbi:MAG: LysE family translocator, partial [Caldimonas sp.]